MALGVEHRLDDDRSGEVTAMIAKATRLIEDRFQRAHPGEGIIGESPTLKEVLRQVELVALTDTTILLRA
jgi:transcriptional regulator with GAF, ATPase, and Fis domain